MVEHNDVDDKDSSEDVKWNFKSGPTTYWNIPSAEIRPPIIELNSPTITEYHGAVITPRVITPRRKTREESRTRYAEGAVFDGNLNLLPIFAEREVFETANNFGNLLKNPSQLPESRLKDAVLLSGRYIYLGYLRGHFGHFLLESISRMWAVLENDPNINIVMHGHQDLDKLPSYIRHVFSLLGLDAKRITMVRQTVIVENLIYPECEFEIRWKASASYADLFRELYHRNSRLFPTSGTPNRVYLTRRQLKVKNDRARMKVVQNEEAVESLFASRGFEIIAPETLPFHQQISTMGRARQIAGAKGSAIHMSLFNQQPEARVIQLCKRPSTNQTIVNGVTNLDAHDIGCLSSPGGDGNIVDIKILHAALRAM